MIVSRPEHRRGYTEGHRTFRPVITVTQVNTGPLLWLKERFGGIVRVKVHNHNKARCRPVCIWEASAQVLDDFLATVRPYLIVKAAAADTAIEFRKLMVPKPWRITEELAGKRKLLHDKMRDLNRRGVAA